MLYSVLRSEYVETGDLVIVQGTSVISRLIRALTGQSFSHVGVLAFIDEAKTCLMVVEMKEFVGWRTMRASDWLEDADNEGAMVFYCKRPESAGDESAMFDYLFKRRKLAYDYFGLIKVWLSAFFMRSFRKNIDHRDREVCSTFAAGCWAKGGWEKPNQDFNPGTFLRHCVWSCIILSEPDPIEFDDTVKIKR